MNVAWGGPKLWEPGGLPGSPARQMRVLSVLLDDLREDSRHAGGALKLGAEAAIPLVEQRLGLLAREVLSGAELPSTAVMGGDAPARAVRVA